MHNPDIPYLLIPNGPKERVAFEAPVLTIGRVQLTDVCLPSDAISRRHCRFYRVGSTFWVQDWYSTGGIHYRGERVLSVQGLLAGEGVSQAVRVGNYDVHVECPAVFEGNPRADLDAITEWIETLDNDFAQYYRDFWTWAEAMRAEV